ncbi:hypothetical protein [Halobacterium litoreum]|uniref:Uncharacterized protein n=1 Tax=Halobacterium litoreum TaxID=2039234 RepID=A0ABD5NF31_9EURY|nr:hypothetical protein [Halobacterium litoreum]UHH13480.1 hypothetical protein LT972_00445 [Halobacterium litoreum]
MGPIERAIGVAGAIGVIIAGLMLLTCIPHLGEPGFNMKACVLPVIPQIAVPNFPLIILLALVFGGLLVWSWVDDQGF